MTDEEYIRGYDYFSSVRQDMGQYVNPTLGGPNAIYDNVRSTLARLWQEFLSAMELAERAPLDAFYDIRHAADAALMSIAATVTGEDDKEMERELRAVSEQLTALIPVADGAVAPSMSTANAQWWGSAKSRIEREIEFAESLFPVLTQISALTRSASASVQAAEQSAKEAKSAAQAATDAAGAKGSRELEKSYERYATSERVQASKFRAWTIALLSVTIGVSLTLAAAGFVFPNTLGEPQEIAYRVATLAALAALAAYLGRQSAHHRKAAVWAEAVSVQLRTWEAFVSPLDSTTKSAMYEIFGRRVLGSPPEVGSKAADTSNPLVEPLLDLVAKMTKS